MQVNTVVQQEINYSTPVLIYRTWVLLWNSVCRLLPSVWLEKKHLHRCYREKRAEQWCYFGSQWHSLRSRTQPQVQELIFGRSSAQLLPAGCLCSVPLLSPALTSPFLLCLLWEGKDKTHLLLCCDLCLSTLLLRAGVSAVRSASGTGAASETCAAAGNFGDRALAIAKQGLAVRKQTSLEWETGANWKERTLGELFSVPVQVSCWNKLLRKVGRKEKAFSSLLSMR